MEWLKINEDTGDVEFATEEVGLVPEMAILKTLNYNKADGDIDGRKRKRGKEELRYMLLVYSPKSPYRDYKEDERMAEARIDCRFKESWKPSEELKKAIEKYQKGSINKVTRSLKTAEKFLEKFEGHLESISLNERNSNGGLVHDPGKVMSTLKQLPDFLLTIQELERQAKLDILSSPKSKGDHELGWMAIQQPNIKARNEEGEVSGDI